MGKAEENKVLIISGQETFSVMGIEKKLKEDGYHGYFVPTRLKALEEAAEGCVLIIYYIDESVYEDTSFLVYLKDLCVEDEVGLILIGKRVEYDEVRKVIPGERVLDWFERPLQMDKFLLLVRAYMERHRILNQRRSILIVDDDVAYMQMIRGWLKDTYNITMVNSGIKAIRWLTNNEADLVLLDVEMPVTTGTQLLEMLKSDTETNDVPVMFLTGQMSQQVVMTAMRLKPVDYLLKTIDRATLRNKIKSFFAIKKGQEKHMSNQGGVE